MKNWYWNKHSTSMYGYVGSRFLCYFYAYSRSELNVLGFGLNFHTRWPAVELHLGLGYLRIGVLPKLEPVEPELPDTAVIDANTTAVASIPAEAFAQ
jgi:hypothetical protein